MCSVRRLIGVVLVVAAVALVPASAEVGVAVAPNGSLPVSYIIAGITDDPEPIGNAWISYFAEGTGRKVLNSQGFANGDGAPSLTVTASRSPGTSGPSLTPPSSRSSKAMVSAPM